MTLSTARRTTGRYNDRCQSYCRPMKTMEKVTMVMIDEDDDDDDGDNDDTDERDNEGADDEGIRRL